ncbi:MAG: zinc ABC transporter substrate-binding protein [Parabacteroides sp.]|nr:zinc ABC transporter substrate-binding protein [Parabacteroides sp.]
MKKIRLYGKATGNSRPGKPERSLGNVYQHSLWKCLALGLWVTLLSACSSTTAPEKTVTVTIEPQRYFAEAIAGDKYTVKSMVGAGFNPEEYDPTPRQMVDLGKSEAYFRIGPIGFEQVWMNRIRENNPGLRIFDLSEGFDFTGDSHEGEEEEPGHGHTHAHGGTDPHLWSSITGAKQIAYNTLEAFIALDPENKAYYTDNYQSLLQEINETEKVLHSELDTLQNRTFIIYHPALTYLAREFGLKQLPIELDGKEPSPAQLKKLIETARDNGVEVVFVQQEFDKKNAELIANETGCTLVSINPLSYDWHGEMVRISNALAHGQVD